MYGHPMPSGAHSPQDPWFGQQGKASSDPWSTYAQGKGSPERHHVPTYTGASPYPGAGYPRGMRSMGPTAPYGMPPGDFGAGHYGAVLGSSLPPPTAPPSDQAPQGFRNPPQQQQPPSQAAPQGFQSSPNSGWVVANMLNAPTNSSLTTAYMLQELGGTIA